MHPEATRMRTDAWSAAPLHRKAAAWATAIATPPRSGVACPWIFFPPGRSTTPSLAARRRQTGVSTSAAASAVRNGMRSGAR